MNRSTAAIMDLDNFRALLNKKPAYRVFSVAWAVNERIYGNEFRECAKDVFDLLTKLVHFLGSDMETALDDYCGYVMDYNKDHREYLRTGRYRYSRIADVEASEEWQGREERYPLVLLFSVILSTHRFEIYRYLRHALKTRAKKGGRCLEIGTGCGLDAAFLSKHFALKTFDRSRVSSRCVGVLFPELRDRYEEKIYDFSDADYFDVVVMAEVIEHCEEPPVILKKLWNVLKPEGICFITFAIRMPQIDHVYHFRTVEEARNMLASNRLTIVDDYYAITSLTYIPYEKRAEYASDIKYPVNYCCLVGKGR